MPAFLRSFWDTAASYPSLAYPCGRGCASVKVLEMFRYFGLHFWTNAASLRYESGAFMGVLAVQMAVGAVKQTSSYNDAMMSITNLIQGEASRKRGVAIIVWKVVFIPTSPKWVPSAEKTSS